MNVLQCSVLSRGLCSCEKENVRRQWCVKPVWPEMWMLLTECNIVATFCCWGLENGYGAIPFSHFYVQTKISMVKNNTALSKAEDNNQDFSCGQSHPISSWIPIWLSHNFCARLCVSGHWTGYNVRGHNIVHLLVCALATSGAGVPSGYKNKHPPWEYRASCAMKLEFEAIVKQWLMV